MKFFRRKGVALVLSAALVLASTLLSVDVKFGRMAQDVTDVFYNMSPTEADNGVYRSTASHLTNLCSYADGLVTIADNYGLDTEDVDWDSESLRLSQSYSKNELSYVYYCYSDLCSSLDKLIDQMHRAELSERDASGLEQYENSIAGAKAAIETAGNSYNQYVQTFLRQYDHFPTDFLAELAGVDMPEYFAYD